MMLSHTGTRMSENARAALVPDTFPAGQELVLTGTISDGPHGYDFVPDQLTQIARANFATGQGPIESLPWLVSGSDAAMLPLGEAVARGRRQGIPGYGMSLRVSLRGRLRDLPSPLSGFEREFVITEVGQVTPCPLRPAQLDGCSN